MLQEYATESMQDLKLEEELLQGQEALRREITFGIRNCCSGNLGARELVREIIYLFLSKKLSTEERINRVVSFDEPNKMTSWQQLETMIYYCDEEDGQGFRHLCEKVGWNRSGLVISAEEVYRAYVNVTPILSLADKKKIVSQLLFADTVGLGVVDTLNYQKGYIEEIQIGMSGKTERQYDYKEALSGRSQSETYSKDGVYLMANGCMMWLKAISFETEEEQQRVLRNLIKEAKGGELSQNHPMLVAETVDGRRISVSRPPMTDTWVGLIRKFDTVQAVTLDRLYRDYPEGRRLSELLRQLVRSGRNIAITGEMASGKTTLFRACLKEIKQEMNIRVIEVDSFELYVRSFLPEANSMTMRVTEQTPAEEVMAFARKTTGQVFAIGEINSAAVAMMAIDLSKIASQMFFSAHYVTTEQMIADFVNAKLCIGGYSDEVQAELDVTRCLGFDIHLRTKQGKRYVQYINEVVPVARKKQGERTYVIRNIYRYDEEKEQGILLNVPGETTYENAKQLLDREEYMEFFRFFEREVSENLSIRGEISQESNK